MIKNLLIGTIITICIGGASLFFLIRFGDPTLSWNTYINTTYGFTLKYPRGLTLSAIPIDIQQARLVYDEFCKKQEGCGAARWPEYVVNFETDENMSIFMLDIYQIPMQLNLGEKIQNNFTFLIREPYNIYYFQDLKDIPKRFIDAKTLRHIQQSIRFISPDTPLPCLWNNAYKPALPDTYRMQVEYEGKIATVSGYYFQKETHTCEQTAYDTWIYEVETASPPFSSQSFCEATCLQKR